MRATLLLLMGCCAGMSAQAAAYDPLEDLVSSAKKEINAKDAIESSKKRVLNDPRRKKIEDGHWQFFQGKRSARPGESCTAVFWKADRMITIVGPGDNYKGAMLSFIAIEPPAGFPRPEDGKATEKVKVRLTQGADAPATVTAFNRTIGGFGDEIAFAVPTIEAALAGMEDRLRFRIDFEGKEVFDLEWHSGRSARDMLKRCLSGERVDGLGLP